MSFKVIQSPSNQTDLINQSTGNQNIKIYRIDAAHAEPAQAPNLFLSKCIAAVLLIPCLPIMGFFMLITRLTSSGPALYKQERVGYNGKLFTLYKIRSMRVDAESKSGAVWARAQDPRVTQLGKFLRWSHIDELPQLFNVLKGEMCFVGPRPERPVFVNDFLNKIERYDERLLTPPGITGLAQVCLPPDNPDAGLQTVVDKLSMEIAYFEQKAEHSLLDMRIFLATGLKIIGIPRSRYTSWLGLNKVTPVEISVRETERRVAA